MFLRIFFKKPLRSIGQLVHVHDQFDFLLVALHYVGLCVCAVLSDVIVNFFPGLTLVTILPRLLMVVFSLTRSFLVMLLLSAVIHLMTLVSSFSQVSMRWSSMNSRLRCRSVGPAVPLDYPGYPCYHPRPLHSPRYLPLGSPRPCFRPRVLQLPRGCLRGRRGCWPQRVLPRFVRHRPRY